MKNTLKIISGFVIIALISVLGFFVYNSFTAKASQVATIKDGLPQFALSDKSTENAYASALELQEQFKYLTCYCGCGTHAMSHRGKVIPKMYSLKDCFIKSDGTWEDHAALDCPACVELATEAANMLKGGASLKQVRNYIDNKYGIYGGGTQTPYPNA